MEKAMLTHSRSNSVTLSAGAVSVTGSLLLSQTVRQAFTINYIYFSYYIKDAVTGFKVSNTYCASNVFKNNLNSPISSPLVNIQNTNSIQFYTTEDSYNSVNTNLFFAPGDLIDYRIEVVLSSAATNNNTVVASAIIGYTLG